MAIFIAEYLSEVIFYGRTNIYMLLYLHAAMRGGFFDNEAMMLPQTPFTNGSF